MDWTDKKSPPAPLLQGGEKSSIKGKVFLLGAGPGHPKLITLRAIECIRDAEVIIYDYLANQKFLQYAPKGCEIIYAGKTSVHHTLHQDEINQLLIDKARTGKTVIRLKGGDPLLYGRGGEEAEGLAREGIPFEIVPGIPAATAIAAYAGIPLTHRDSASTVAFITGHEGSGKSGPPVDWEKISTGVGTVVIYMGVGNLQENTRKLMEHGRAPETPTALVRWGTTPEQEILIGTLADIYEKARTAHFKAPAIMIVGETVRLHDKLHWTDQLPLFGRRIALTRERENAGLFSKELERLGAVIYYLPAISIFSPEEFGIVDQAIEEIEQFDWIIFTSANAVRYFLDRLIKKNRDVRDLKGISICTVGTATARSLKTRGIRTDLIPEEFTGEGVVAALLKEGDLPGKRVLIPRAEKAREVVPDALREAGAEVVVATVYRNLAPEIDAQALQEILINRKADLIVFTSPSNIRNFVRSVQKEGLQKTLPGIRTACIGPVTAKAAKEAGLDVVVEPEKSTLESVSEAIRKYFAEKQ
ncbi:MAG: uroporphyrinogen-III C-methyltransferase [Deltaproteobacteria bacterium]|nr:uroporphyrinogen-III C-methyltransferase [Deltaproteobacteria bacterium]